MLGPIPAPPTSSLAVCVFLFVLPSHRRKKKGQQRESEQAGLERVRAYLQAVSLDGCRRQSALLIIMKPFESIISKLSLTILVLCGTSKHRNHINSCSYLCSGASCCKALLSLTDCGSM